MDRIKRRIKNSNQTPAGDSPEQEAQGLEVQPDEEKLETASPEAPDADFSVLTADTTRPVFGSAVTSVDGLSIDVVLTETDSPPILPATNILGFSIKINGGSPVSITTAARKGTGSPDNVTITLVVPSVNQISPGQTVTVSYVPGTTVTDSATTPNALLAFSNQAVTNSSCEHVKPVVASVVTDTTGLILTITFTEAGSPPVTFNTGGGRNFQDGWAVNTTVVGGSPASHAIASTTHPSNNVWTLTLSTAITCEQDAVISYVSSSGTVRDSAAVPNYLASLSMPVTNNAVDVVQPIFGSAASSADGSYIDVVIIERCTPPLLPATAITGFEVFVNGATRAIASANRVGSTGADSTKIRLVLSEVLHPSDTVVVAYQSSGNVTDSASALNPLVPFSNSVSMSGVLSIPPPFFDVIDWTQSGFLSSVPIGDIIERRVGYPLASVLMDTTPPVGDVVLNEYPNSGGIQCHHFDIFDNSTTPIALAAYGVVQDILENTIRVSHVLGGSVDTSSVENIGVGNQFSFVKYLSPISGTTYPAITSIEFCMTAARAKDYVLEVKATPNDVWHQLQYMIANSATLQYYKYTFASALQLSAVRLRYRGDYYAPTNVGTLTVAGYDLLSDIDAVQISHYPDFRDATEFPNADGDGWVPFTEGVSLFSWNLLNTARVWTQYVTCSGAVLKNMLAFAGGLVVASSRYIYVISPLGSVTQTYDAGGGVTIGAVAVYQGQIYAGLSNGLLIASPTGTSFATLNPSSAIAPIRAMANFGGKLWIGTGPDVSSQANVYVWNGSNLTKSRAFNEPEVDSMTSASGFLFVGVGGGSGQGLGKIYYSDGTTWSLTLVTQSDNIDTMALATLDGRLWAGLAGGTIYALTFVSSKPNSWKKVYDQAAGHFTHIVDDPNGNFLWIISDAGVLAFVEALTAFSDTPQPVSTTVNDMAYLGGVFYGAAANGHVYAIDSSVLTTHVRAVYVRYRDRAGNITSMPGLSDDIVQDTQHQSGVRTSSGAIHQVTPDTQAEVATYVSSVQKSLYAPDRRLRQTGYYEAEPFYSATLNHWGSISIIGNFSAGIDGLPGMEKGVQVDIYVRTGDTREAVLTASWGDPFTYTTIGTPSNAGSGITTSFNIQTRLGKWLQYKVVLTSASRGYTPVLQAVTLTYTSSQATYFFTELFDTNNKIAGPPYSQFRRGILTANSVPNGGFIQFGYLTDPSSGNAFDYTRYTPIKPNSVFEIPLPTRYLRFAIMLVTVDSAHPAVVDEFAVQLDAGPDDMYWMR